MRKLFKHKYWILGIGAAVICMLVVADYTNTFTGGGLYVKTRAQITITADLDGNNYDDIAVIGFDVKIVNTNGSQSVSINTARSKTGDLITLLGGNAAATSAYETIRTALVRNLTP